MHQICTSIYVLCKLGTKIILNTHSHFIRKFAYHVLLVKVLIINKLALSSLRSKCNLLSRCNKLERLDLLNIFSLLSQAEYFLL